MIPICKLASRTTTLWWFAFFCLVGSCSSVSAQENEAGPAENRFDYTETTAPESEFLANTDVSASLRFNYFSSSRSLDDRRHYPGITGELKAVHRLSDDDRLNFKMRSSLYRSDDQQGVSGKTRLVDAYWLSQGEIADVRIGQQLVRWGRADAINPIDFFTPNDFRVYLPLEEDRRLSIPAVRTDFHILDDGQLTLVAEPHFTPTYLPQPSGSPIQINERRPDNMLTQPQVGARYSETGENLDWSVAGFSGYSTQPLLSVDTGPTDALFLRSYPRIFGVGGDLARNFGKVGFRAELAYIHPYDMAPETGIEPYFFLVTGVDRALDNLGLDDWNINVQLVMNYSPGVSGQVPAADTPAHIAQRQNKTLYAQVNRTQVGATARISADWLHETLQTELFTYVTADPWNYFIRPLVTYAITDEWKLLAGAEFYAGSQLGFFGQLEENRTIFVELKRDF